MLLLLIDISMATTDNLYPKIDFAVDLNDPINENVLANEMQRSIWYSGSNFDNNINKKHQDLVVLYGSEARYYLDLIEQDESGAGLGVPFRAVGGDIFSCTNGVSDRTFNGKSNDLGINLLISSIEFGVSNASFNAVALQGDDKMVAVGTIRIGVVNNFLVARFNLDGTVDKSFGVNGFVILSSSVAATNDNLFGVQIQKDQKIVAAGLALHPSTLDNTGVSIRLNIDGTLDTSYGGTGIVFTNVLLGFLDQFNNIHVNSDDNIYMCGFVTSGVSNGTIVVLRPNGSIISSSSFPIGANTQFYDIKKQSNGSFIACGFLNNVGINDFYVMRTTNAIGFDLSFNATGYQNITINGIGSERANALAINPDDSIILAGFARNAIGFDAVLVKVLPNGGLDATFGVGGIVRFNINNINQFFDVAIQLDGKIVACGVTSNVSLIARFNADGTLDTTYNGVGYNFKYQGSNFSWRGLALQSFDQKQLLLVNLFLAHKQILLLGGIVANV